MKHCLITGGDSGNGAVLANYFSRDYRVWTAQSKPRPERLPEEYVSDENRHETWLPTNFNEPTDVLVTVQAFVVKDIQFDFVIHGYSYYHERDLELLDYSDMQEHFMRNVISPLLLLKYMKQYDVVKPSTLNIVMLDYNRYDKSKVSFEMCNMAQRSLFTTFFKAYDDLQFVFVIPPKDVPGSEDTLTRDVGRVVLDTKTAGGAVIDLR